MTRDACVFEKRLIQNENEADSKTTHTKKTACNLAYCVIIHQIYIAFYECHTSPGFPEAHLIWFTLM